MKKFFATMLIFAIEGCSGEPVLNVKGIKEDISKYTQGKVIVEGVVATWQSDKQNQFGIVDISEVGQQKQHVVPVRYDGPKPAPGTKVRVTGTASIEAHEFQATKVTVMK